MNHSVLTILSDTKCDPPAHRYPPSVLSHSKPAQQPSRLQGDRDLLDIPDGKRNQYSRATENGPNPGFSSVSERPSGYVRRLDAYHHNPVRQ